MRARGLLLAGAAVIVVAGSALAPVWAAAPAGRATASDGVVPGELIDALLEKCIDATVTPQGQFLFPIVQTSATGDHLRVALYEVDDDEGNVDPVEPTGVLVGMIDQANACLAPYVVSGWVQQTPVAVDAFHRNMYYDYVAGVLVPCFAAQGVEAASPSRAEFARLDVGEWYLHQLTLLDFDAALAVWQRCPQVPDYIELGPRPADLSDFAA